MVIFPSDLLSHHVDYTAAGAAAPVPVAACSRASALGSGSLMPNSTCSTVLLNAPIVSPYGVLILGSQPLGRRSSMRNVRRSSTWPPNRVNMVHELCPRIISMVGNKTHQRYTHFELPNIRWARLVVYWGLVALASARLIPE